MSKHPEQPAPDLTASAIFNVRGFNAVVTGGSSGIGLMIAQALVANGAHVSITGRSQEKLQAAAERYSGGGAGAGTITPIVADVTSKDSIKDLVAQVSKACPDGLQLLVNNAGVARDTTALQSFDGDENDAVQLAQFFFEQGEPQAWADTFATNATAHFFVSWAFVPLLAKGRERTGAGSIVNISSDSGLSKQSSGGLFAYATSKAAANHLTKMLAVQLAPTKIRVNAIAPGLFPSEMTTGKSGSDQKADPFDLGENYDARPARRPGRETDIGAAVLYLASAGGEYVNGHILAADGGSLLTGPSVV
ncbi:SDR family oxidoreductase [Phanerochaete sordida]|uniref:SDR family oxidoreductase n=1 Tax=Phanerochaete sordida TaxID=48140 RepID=A0A9P3GQ61_9APHY|nr:SDR family oxidoreductase [Phanerochaete sordida]